MGFDCIQRLTKWFAIIAVVLIYANPSFAQRSAQTSSVGIEAGLFLVTQSGSFSAGYHCENYTYAQGAGGRIGGGFELTSGVVRTGLSMSWSDLALVGTLIGQDTVTLLTPNGSLRPSLAVTERKATVTLAYFALQPFVKVSPPGSDWWVKIGPSIAFATTARIALRRELDTSTVQGSFTNGTLSETLSDDQIPGAHRFSLALAISVGMDAPLVERLSLSFSVGYEYQITTVSSEQADHWRVHVLPIMFALRYDL